MFFQKYRQNVRFFNVAANPVDVLGLLEPVNLEEEMMKWLASPGKSYNPQFIYDEDFIAIGLKSLRKLRKVIGQIAKDYAGTSDWRAVITHDYLTNHSADIDATILILNAFLENQIDHDCAKTVSDQLFGEITPAEFEIAKALPLHRNSEVIKNQLIRPDERHLFDQAKLESVIHGFLRDFNGIISAEEINQFHNKVVTGEQVCSIFEKVIHYMTDHARGNYRIHIKILFTEKADRFGILPVPLLPFHYEITVPRPDKLPQGKMTADDLLQTVAHELNSHLRSQISTDELITRTSPHFRLDLVTRCQRNLVQEGFATLNGDACLDEADRNLLEPMLVLAPLYARQGHNFAETVKYVYGVYNIDPDLDYAPLHRDIWTIMQFFYGVKDTSAHIGYVFPWEQAYFLGPLRTLREIARIDKDNFEDPLSMMRYSELPFELIQKINHIEKQLGTKLAPDPFETWDFANPNPNLPNPTEYCKQLLLDL